jgi:hypothetical protein
MGEEPTAPGASLQPATALQHANRVRRIRSELKTRIAHGQLSAAEVILICPPEIARMPLAQLLTSQRGWGDGRSLAFLAEVGLREDKSIGSLTERQRRAVASRLIRESRGDHAVAVGPTRDDKR